MRSLIAIAGVVLLLIIVSCSNSSPTSVESANKTHLGGAVLLEPIREADDSIFTIGEIKTSSNYQSYTKVLEAYGVTFIAKPEIPDQFLIKVAGCLEDIFKDGDGIESELQREVVRNLYRYHAILPVVIGEPNDLSHPYPGGSICDIIMKTDENQAMEVVEHLLHTITDVGFHHTVKDLYGLDSSSQLHASMSEAISGSYYNISSYSDFDGDSDVKERILLQEYIYWIITSNWDIQENYGVGDIDEWSLQNSQLLEENLPTAKQLCDNEISKIVSKPSEEILNGF